MDDARRLYRPAFALVYAYLLDPIQRVAREHGYAVAVHGSMMTDLDLLACPWSEAASDARTLVEALREYLSLIYHHCSLGEPAEKPHGRLAWSLIFDMEGVPPIGGPYLDISVMPRLAQQEAPDARP